MKPRKRIIAFLLSIFSVGLGQLYAGEPKKGFLLMGLQYLVFAVLLVGYPWIWVMYACILLGLLIFLINLVLAVRAAGGKKSYQLAPYNRWYVYLLYFLIFSMLIPSAIDVRGSYFEAFKSPSSSMSPLLKVGDHFLVDKSWYWTHQPQRGDVVVFRSPNDPGINVIKRIVATAGDTVEVKGTKLLLNGRETLEPYAFYLDGGVKDFASMKVPDNHVFMLGDNRDASKDSRYYVDNAGEIQPFVPVESISGKALYIYYNGAGQHDRIGMKLSLEKPLIPN